MDFSTWEPVYEAILADFGYDRPADERARDLLASLVADAPTDPYDPAPDMFAGQTVAIAGAGPSLSTELEPIESADAVIAASTAADQLLEVGVSPDIVVTDLDKHSETVRELTRSGIPVAVHAHGDNIAAVKESVPTFDLAWVLPTTQAEPVDPVRNFGGFTDGDRAAFLADALGADRLVFPGWDFDDRTVGIEKERKLEWAERLLHWLEGRRDENFDVLDGRRDSSEPIEQQ
ncbi:6-hydroxymethylpterin diphosphokinase MptE-like protein [Halorhabdus salina]|uniref:6-hydroxymethylpterin diphosphokinase MptE-like protein n=1 Tax=Halorhabdus salina TaxID=2750670 RepID=UPI0015EF2C8A|nr:6-hydroxymethylpterin diphosphokinase MptE-like protein [Halorhabdus salina]